MPTAPKRWLVLLQVALICEREALEDREDRGQCRDRAGGTASDELGRIRFFLLGMIELPVENASDTRTNPNRGFDHQVSSSASRLRCTIPSATAASTSTTKSRSETASSEFAVTP